MRNTLLAAIVLFGWTLPALPQAAADTPANRLAAAKRYLKAVPPMEMAGASLDQLAERVPEDRREEFRQTVAEVLRSERIEKITLDAIIKHFTVREINALTAFYGSQEGRSITKMFSLYMADVMPAIQQELTEAIDKVHKESH